MANIRMFNIKGKVEELPSKQVTLEKELQKLLEENMDTFFGVTFLKSEYQITDGRMDSIGIDRNNCPVIFEYKRNINGSVISQGLHYLSWVREHKADYKLLVMEVLGQEKANHIKWNPYVICIANDFEKHDRSAIKEEPNVVLVRYCKFGDNLIAFEYLNTSSVHSFHGSAISKSVGSGDGKDIKQYRGEDIEKLFSLVEKHILSLGKDIIEKENKRYVVFKKSRNIFCVQKQKKKILIRLKLNPDEISLSHGFIEDARSKGNWGEGNVQITIKSAEDLKKVEDLIYRAYHEN